MQRVSVLTEGERSIALPVPGSLPRATAQVGRNRRASLRIILSYIVAIIMHSTGQGADAIGFVTPARHVLACILTVRE
jgi:hypothetical protein